MALDSKFWFSTMVLPWTYFVIISRQAKGSTKDNICRNPTLRECEDETHTPEMGIWESFGTPETSEFDCKGENTLH